MYSIKQFFKRIYNLYRWLPIIWKDQDWDTHYIWEILKFKLKNQADYIGSKDRYINAKRDAEIMNLCIRLINKIQNEDYEHEWSKYYESESRLIPSEKFPGSYEWDVEKVSESFDDYFVKYPRIYIAVENMEKPSFLKDTKLGMAINIGFINHIRAKKLLFKILEENIEKWWD